MITHIYIQVRILHNGGKQGIDVGNRFHVFHSFCLAILKIWNFAVFTYLIPQWTKEEIIFRRGVTWSIFFSLDTLFF